MHFTCLLMTVLFLTACGTPAQTDDPVTPPSAGPVGRILEEIPDPVDLDGRYLIYLHNRFAETAQPDERHPIFGDYDLHGILEALAERRFIVIATQREPQADPVVWATRVAGQVERLIAAGVPPEKITVVGFSKGGAIAILASSRLAGNTVNFVFLAACGDWLERIPDLEPRGRMLSIIEASDDLAGSCGDLFAVTPDGTIHHEVEIHIGGGHGAFFRTHDEWLRPTIDWAKGLPPADNQIGPD